MKVEISPREIVRNEYREREALFGIVRWEERIKSDVVGNELHIFADKKPDKIFFNGEELTQTK